MNNECGVRGCHARTKRLAHVSRRLNLPPERFCAQKAIDGTGYCYYHQPDAPRVFGEGYARNRENSWGWWLCYGLDAILQLKEVMPNSPEPITTAPRE